ncbi:ribonuclease III [Roseiterribacter gracilis]|uniref:Ribonuclease 3 n=1 Tax=Roseiterribacter gracilis TaxID=2812848 RepID=A0A8S8X6C4_9PROT|nr:ribonuclease 3 [Rhodospirillales bacterium TMPK1]
MSARDFDALERRLMHRFARPQTLERALTHSSYARQSGGNDNERLEFLGDRVLGLVVADLVLDGFPDAPEGQVAKRHAVLVQKNTLAVIAGRIELATDLKLSSGEEEQGGRANPGILADAMEAVIGALYLDGGLAVARRFIEQAWGDLVEAMSEAPQDAKTSLQEWAQARGKKLPVYEVMHQKGPDHDPVFTVRVFVEGLEPATAEAPSKRAAEKLAAQKLLDVIGS